MSYRFKTYWVTELSVLLLEMIWIPLKGNTFVQNLSLYRVIVRACYCQGSEVTFLIKTFLDSCLFIY